MRWIVALAMVVATPAAAADQFDLVCTGDDEPWHYRIDLTKGEWCADDCKTTFALASVTSATLTIKEQQPKFRGDDRIVNSVNRVTGEWYFYRDLPKIGFSKVVKGECKPAPFSGFGADKAKF